MDPDQTAPNELSDLGFILFASLKKSSMKCTLVEEPGFKNVKNKHLGMPPF